MISKLHGRTQHAYVVALTEKEIHKTVCKHNNMRANLINTYLHIRAQLKGLTNVVFVVLETCHIYYVCSFDVTSNCWPRNKRTHNSDEAEVFCAKTISVW